MQVIEVSAFRSPKKNELYLFVPKEHGLEKLPKELITMFGEPKHIFDFELTPDRKMAREDGKQVYEAIQTKGYFMQMPPAEVEKLSDYAPAPEKLDNIY
ncbi:YcgL domain-containing protein [Thiosulfatimonas sediminis]|uniref:YcgL domain-containing protein THMIRHAS_02810 n=1 Tax=Thiosulfatimonas sediminis TaxID=2675054 RepID=A0A6F8PSB0_9GAMM|nr:YcgL domain-containing protein [Thiosulfatimonas sediminis]BBP44908.1 YcgL domain-containing protein [Thiosulfatimonas sediminis]